DQIARFSEMIRPDRTAVLADLEVRLTDWRTLLRDQATKARRSLRQLLVGRPEMVPDRARRVYTFTGTGTLVPLITVLIPGFRVSWRSASCPHKRDHRRTTEWFVPNGIRTRVL